MGRTVTTTTKTRTKGPPAATLPPEVLHAGQAGRHGDVLLRPVSPVPPIPAEAAPLGADGAVLVEGRMAHVLRGEASVLRGDPARIWIGPGGATLLHERGGQPADHRAIGLAAGACYDVLPQRVVGPADLVERTARD